MSPEDAVAVPPRRRAWVSWSSGKDSAWALHVATRDLDIDVVGLLVTVDDAASRVAMHGVRDVLVDAQAERLGLPVHVVRLPWPCPNAVYEARMAEATEAARACGVTQMVFGDLFLEDIREYRERALAGSGVEPVFPLWDQATAALAREMIDGGLRAALTCVDTARLAETFAGAEFDAALLEALPRGVDPCGERGEFHTFVWDAPGFSSPIRVARGAITVRDGFATCDLRPRDRS